MKPSAMGLSGRVYGRLTVVSQAKPPTGLANPGIWWFCDCECGTKSKKIRQDHLLRPVPTKSCGCLRRERMATVRRKNYGKQET